MIINPHRPWWERYQPISYNITSRSGNEKEFLNMTTRCNAVGIRVYVDVVLNHMTGDSFYAIGTGGSTASPEDFSYPAIPFTSAHFNPRCPRHNHYQNLNIIRDCQLYDYKDLDLSSSYVREKQLEFLNKLIDYGVAGFRIDAALNMWPEDLQNIYNGLKNLNPEHGFAPWTRPLIYQEVDEFKIKHDTELREEYLPLGMVTEFRYGEKLSQVLRGYNELSALKDWGPDWGLIQYSHNALVFIDNHRTQRIFFEESQAVLNYQTPKWYKMAIAFMLAHPYGNPRIMSSYYFNDAHQGPPQDKNGYILSPGENPNGSCKNGWVCEHRWKGIYGMVQFRNAVEGTKITKWWSDGDDQIAFCRGNKGFIAFTNDEDIDRVFNVCVPPGTYCDVITGNLVNGTCTGKTIIVIDDGTAVVKLMEDEPNGMVAIHVQAKQEVA